MIAYMKGIVAGKTVHGAVIEVGGIGYSLAMSTAALAALPSPGGSAQIWTHLQVKEDGLTLFGFSDTAEREMFNRLIGVSGIGPKMALSALSTYRPDVLASIIAEGDVTQVAAVPGIGKKTAQRVILELQGVLRSEVEVPVGASGGVVSEASEALEAMGFSSDEIARALRGYTGGADDVSAVVRQALKNMGGRA